MTNRKYAALKYGFLLCLFTLTGCATYNEGFDCEPGKGIGCVSLSHVNRMVDQGKVPFQSESQWEQSSKNPASHKTRRLWVSAHTDEDGVRHEDSLLHVPIGDTPC
jgi:hypothetical protein